MLFNSLKRVILHHHHCHHLQFRSLRDFLYISLLGEGQVLKGWPLILKGSKEIGIHL
jgi:hypothetical protein